MSLELTVIFIAFLPSLVVVSFLLFCGFFSYNNNNNFTDFNHSDDECFSDSYQNIITNDSIGPFDNMNVNQSFNIEKKNKQKIKTNFSQYSDKDSNENMYKFLIKILYVIKILMFIHGILDLIGAVILYLWPDVGYVLFGFPKGDYTLSGIIAAAFFDISFVSFRSWDRSIAYTTAILDFKIPWSFTVVIWAIFQVINRKILGESIPLAVWLFLGSFSVGFTLWITSRILIFRYFPYAGASLQYYDDTKYLINGLPDTKKKKI